MEPCGAATQRRIAYLKKKIGRRKAEIAQGKAVLLVEDECHLVWGDLLGYVWAPKGERAEAPIKNERQRQTYYGVLNLVDGTTFTRGHARGNGQETIKFLQALLGHYPDKQLILLWDKASYHDCRLVRAFLKQVNKGLPRAAWRLTLELLPVGAPQENAIESVWLQAKTYVRKHFERCKTFADVKAVFEEFLKNAVFRFDKMKIFGIFNLQNN